MIEDWQAGQKVGCSRCREIFVVRTANRGRRGQDSTTPPRAGQTRVTVQRAAPPPRGAREESARQRRPRPARPARRDTGRGVLLVLAGVGLVLLVGAVCTVVAVMRSKANDAGQQAGRGATLSPASSAAPVQPDSRGELVLWASKAEIHGTRARYEEQGSEGNIGFWSDAHDYVTWVFAAPQAGTYKVELTYACHPVDAGSTYTIGIKGQEVSGTVDATRDWRIFQTVTVGQLQLAPGTHTLTLRATKMARNAVMNVRAVILSPVQ
jgi:hypothetical protein